MVVGVQENFDVTEERFFFSSGSVSLFLSYPYVLHDIFFLKFHIYVLAYGICLSLSDLLVPCLELLKL